MIGVPLFMYTLDKTMEIFTKTRLIESAHFERLSDTCCIISFENPPGYGKQNSAYVYLMLPWLSRYQFHAFTVFPSNKPNHSSICISKCGNWTQSLIKEISTPTHKPAFIMGPFLSPFSSPAMDSENLVAVASGIGVTPAISLIKQYSCTSRRMNLIWICRDAALVEHFLQSLEFGATGHLLVYYTGKRPLFLNDDLPPNVCIFNGRPNLERTISGVIYSIANEEDLPDKLYQKNSVVTKASPEISAKLILVKALSIYSIDQLFEYAVGATPVTEEEVPPWAAASFGGVLKIIDDLLSDDCELLKRKALKNLDLVDNYG
jgi:ferric-chelate reductase